MSAIGSACCSSGARLPRDRRRRSHAIRRSSKRISGLRTTKMLLEVSGIAIAYGTAQVLHGLSLHVATGETITLIGANGAGKTSCLRAISGLEPLTAGSIRFAGEPIDALSPRQRLERGLVHV